MAANAAYEDARDLVARLDAAGTAAATALKAEVEALAPEPRPTGFGRFFRRGAPEGPPTLNGVSRTLMSAAICM